MSQVKRRLDDERATAQENCAECGKLVALVEAKGQCENCGTPFCADCAPSEPEDIYMCSTCWQAKLDSND